MGKFCKRDLVNLLILALIYIFIVLILVLPGNDYGSTTDWEIQHWAIPEYFRNRFYETGQLFPSFAAEMGAGQNIYYYAYYGLCSPFLYLSYLMPGVDMRTYFVLINIIMVLASVIIFYVWIRHEHKQGISLLLSILFLTATPLTFHSHRHFMFVNYMPFLILALIFVRRYKEGRGRLYPIAIASFLIITSSFYYSVGSFLAIGLYTIMLTLKNSDEKISVREWFKNICPVVAAVITGILMSGILIIPTLYALLSGRNVGEKTDLSVLIPYPESEGVLYDSYGMGMHFILIFALIAAWYTKKKGDRLFSILIASFMLLPVTKYILNGTLYTEPKALIPFVPIGVMVIGGFLLDLKEGKIENRKLKKIILIVTGIAILIAFEDMSDGNKTAHLVESITVVIALLIYIRKKTLKPLYIGVAMSAIAVCISFNLSDELIETDDKRTEIEEDVKNVVEQVISGENTSYRFGMGLKKYTYVNRNFAEGYYNATIYSSTGNKYYKDFYINQMDNEISYRNNAILSTSYNMLFDMYMGIKYFITDTKGVHPADYELIYEDDILKLFYRDDVYPLGYTMDKLITREEYEKLEYPYDMMALMKYCVCEKCDEGLVDQDELESLVEPAELKYTVEGTTDIVQKVSGGYKIINDTGKSENVVIRLDKPISDNLLVISFNVDNTIGERSSDTSIEINGVRNRLTAKGWKYHNRNYNFKYIIDATDGLDTLDVVLSPGEYSITGIECYYINYKSLINTRNNMDELMIDKELTKGDDIYGSINVKQDSWFHLSIPYDEGFTIYVDGKEVEYYKSDIDFMGFDIEKGVHDIHISYKAPGYDIGKYVSIAGFIILAILLITGVVKNIKSGKKK